MTLQEILKKKKERKEGKEKKKEKSVIMSTKVWVWGAVGFLRQVVAVSMKEMVCCPSDEDDYKSVTIFFFRSFYLLTLPGAKHISP